MSSTVSEFVAWAEPTFAGWRYLFSPAYRARKHQDWRIEQWGYVVLDIIGGLIGIGIVVFAFALVIAGTWRAIAT